MPRTHRQTEDSGKTLMLVDDDIDYLAGTIRFNAGVSEGRHTAMLVILVIGVLFFVCTPLVLLFVVRDWRVLGVLGAGAAFMWPFWRIVQNNSPRSYDPRRPPGELME